MKHKKPLAVRIFIRICVFAMAISLIGVYVVYMFAPAQTPSEDVKGTESGTNENGVVEILPEIDSENPENTGAPILVTENEEIDEMNQTVSVQLENGETELVRLGDINDSVQIN